MWDDTYKRMIPKCRASANAYTLKVHARLYPQMLDINYGTRYSVIHTENC